MDTNDGGAVTSQISVTSGTYTIDPVTGRGTATLITSNGTFDFSFYVVSTGMSDFVGTDTSRQVSGAASQQTVNSTFSNASLNGNFAFLLANPASGGTFASAGS